jgi:ubiquitin C-terminal hydrolase
MKTSTVAKKHITRTNVIGIRNIGDSCYMNSLLQCLASVPQIRQLCANHSNLTRNTNFDPSLYYKDLDNNETFSDSDVILQQIDRSDITHHREFSTVLRQLLCELSSTREYKPDHAIQLHVERFFKRFVFNPNFVSDTPLQLDRQEDVQEALNYLLNTEMCNVDPFFSLPIESRTKDDNSTHAFGYGYGTGIFDACYRVTTKILCCPIHNGARPYKLTHTGRLFIEIQPEKDIKHAIMNALNPGLVQLKGVLPSCEVKDHNRTRINVPSYEFTQHWPAVLWVQINRFISTYDTALQKTVQFKLHTAVNIPLTLRFRKGVEYRLVAVSAHEGDTLYSGHYVSYVWRESIDTNANLNAGAKENKKGQWYCINDQHVTRCEQKKVLQNNENAYILFYARMPLSGKGMAQGALVDTFIDKSCEARYTKAKKTVLRVNHSPALLLTSVKQRLPGDLSTNLHYYDSMNKAEAQQFQEKRKKLALDDNDAVPVRETKKYTYEMRNYQTNESKNTMKTQTSTASTRKIKHETMNKTRKKKTAKNKKKKKKKEKEMENNETTTINNNMVMNAIETEIETETEAETEAEIETETEAEIETETKAEIDIDAASELDNSKITLHVGESADLGDWTDDFSAWSQ